ncbi:Sphingolipid C4-hydroxylase sur2 [Tilletia horrida]|uniref:Sphingolipid C4-hydroxylase sur2 n=1 Tax=Tilletia horrida TaxID=155126 RepID=A0AAN6G6K7_9BASI|nr:Sphingolipid C4-hydroxylase sur2 [Tilletia horrida]
MNLTSALAGAGAGAATVGAGAGGKLLSDAFAQLDLAPAPGELHYPFYHAQRASLLPFLSDKLLSLLAPILIYWLVSLAYHTLDVLQLPYFEKFRLHEPEEITKRNKVSVAQVVRMVLVQQAIQTALGLLVLDGDEVSHAQVFADHRADMNALGQTLGRWVAPLLGERRTIELLTAAGPRAIEWLYWWGVPTVQLWWAFLVMDTWQYFFHRAFHESRWLYRNFHSHHHRLYVPYAFGALYNHPLEGLLFDSLGGAVSHKCAFMTIRQGVLLFSFATYKTVSDHGGYALPWYIDPLHLFFPNTAAYHDVHHQMQGLRFNYSQPFFIHFDVLFGTRMSVDKFKKLVEGKKERREKGGGEVAAEASPSTAGVESNTSSVQPSARSKTADLRARRPAAAADAAESIANGNANENGNGHAHVADDLPPSQILKNQIPNGNGRGHPDPLVTTTEADYRAKAGTSTA